MSWYKIIYYGGKVNGAAEQIICSTGKTVCNGGNVVLYGCKIVFYSGKVVCW